MAGRVILSTSICTRDSQCIVETIFDIWWIIGIIIGFFVTNLLKRLILSGVNAKTSTVNSIVSLCFWKTTLILQVIHDLICKCIYKITICVGRICLGFVNRLDSCIYIICHCFIISSLVDISLFQHILKNLITTLLVLLRVRDWIQVTRTLCNTCNNSTFRKSQFWNIFVEISFRSRLNTETVLS